MIDAVLIPPLWVLSRLLSPDELEDAIKAEQAISEWREGVIREMAEAVDSAIMGGVVGGDS